LNRLDHYDVEFGFALPIFPGGGDSHPRTPLLQGIDWPLLRNTISASEKLGFTSVWVADHVMLGLNNSILECWTTLSAVSSLSSRLRLGTIHLYDPFRSPSLVAKMASTLDNISGGRLDFFVDPGHKGLTEECTAYGFPLTEGDDERIERFDEALQIMKRMWTEESASFEGKHYAVKNAKCNPKPVQKPYPPVWIGTMGGEGWNDAFGTDKILRVIAKHADVWNNTPASIQWCAEKLRRLREECLSEGRDYNEIAKSLETQVIIAANHAELDDLLERISTHNPKAAFYRDETRLRQLYILGTPNECIERVNEYFKLGITRFILWFVDFPSNEGMKLFADQVLPSFR
jgi:alkanesulfonate monooxygenase SsuD/methylene tetrahydromethanopterin reductase-like flavin-dependent oxidoreductase (luciferase family)